MQNVWKDPNCGDGICEAPFEFAAFSRFGCKADCGRLSDIQNLTSGQVDIYWDFSHQASSLPASVSTAQQQLRNSTSMLQQLSQAGSMHASLAGRTASACRKMHRPAHAASIQQHPQWNVHIMLSASQT